MEVQTLPCLSQEVKGTSVYPLQESLRDTPRSFRHQIDFSKEPKDYCEQVTHKSNTRRTRKRIELLQNIVLLWEIQADQFHLAVKKPCQRHGNKKLRVYLCAFTPD